MNNNQNTYQQQVPPQMPQGAPMPPMPARRPLSWREQMMRRLGMQESTNPVIFPKWLSKYAIATYILAMAVVTVMYSSHSLPWYYMLSGIVAVIVFFLYGRTLINQTSIAKLHKKKLFEKRIFFIAFIPRFLWMILIYYLFMQYYGDAFGFDNADSDYYDRLGKFVSGLLARGDFHLYDAISKWSGSDDISDMGYGIYVGFVYLLTDNSIIAVRLLKCVWSSLTVVLIYRLAVRNFGENVARMAAIFCTLWPNFWYYCGVHLKETEMVFLCVLFVEQADQMLRSRQFTTWKVIPVLLIAVTIFTFRTPLALVAILSLLFTIVMSSSKVMTWGKRIIVGILAILLIGITMGNRIEEQSKLLLDRVESGSQKTNMEWRSERQDGNTFAKYAGAAVFAPMIFTIPFSTMVRPYEGQEVQQLLNGGNFIKNILSGYVMYALFFMLISGGWRQKLLPTVFVLGYVIVLVMSVFAQSERFHQPIMPFEMMFAAYGLSITVSNPKYKRWLMYWSVLILSAIIAWNWFKLAGRGLA